MIVQKMKFVCVECYTEQDESILDSDDRKVAIQKLYGPPGKCPNVDCPSHKIDPIVLRTVDTLEKSIGGFTTQQRQDEIEAEIERQA